MYGVRRPIPTLNRPPFWLHSGGCDTIPPVQKQYSLPEIYEPIAAAIGDVRGIVFDVWREVLELVSGADGADNEQQAEGKLLRPALCLLSAGALGADILHKYARLAAAYELMHIASLTHDDVVDNAALRRGQNALNVVWSNHAAILGGDYLVARALELLAEYGNDALIGNALRAMRRMAEGELRFFGKDPESAAENDCIVLADSKTASLFAASCAAPATLIAAEYAPALHDFGIALGIAFQLVDDVLDITQPASVLGKPACGDVTECKHTLPLHLLRGVMSPEERAALAAMSGRPLSEAEQGWVRDMVCARGVDKAALSRAEEYVEQAVAAIDPLPDSPCKTSMAALARFVLSRQS